VRSIKEKKSRLAFHPLRNMYYLFHIHIPRIHEGQVRLLVSIRVQGLVSLCLSFADNLIYGSMTKKKKERENIFTVFFVHVGFCDF